MNAWVGLRVGLEPIGNLVPVRFDGIDGFDGIR